jgi:RNA 3'-terminal phosphate cyclase (ATP)
MLEFDGSAGGGQLLRSALSLSMCTGKPFHMRNIRARRNKPGLMRQHLTAVQAAAVVCAAELLGAAPGSTDLEFRPGSIMGGEFAFNVGSAGSTTLVLQTLLPALLMAEGASTLRIQGGTHNPMAPPVDFLNHAWLPLLRRMGAALDLQLDRYGFYPAGGGAVTLSVQPSGLQPIALMQRGALRAISAHAVVAGVPAAVAERELHTLCARLNLDVTQQRLSLLPGDPGPGNALMVLLEHEHSSELIMELGQRGVSAEAVAERLASAARAHLRQDQAAVGHHLADQLLLPMALAGGGHMSTDVWSEHLSSNAALIQRFLPVRISTEMPVEGRVEISVAAC